LAEEIMKMSIKQGDVLIADLNKETSLLEFNFKSRIEEEEAKAES
jgi:ATP-dependent Clp protease ATP-binding subunit ClpC